MNIVARAHKRYRQEIDLELGSQPDVLAIDIRQCRRGQATTLQVDALVIGQNAAVNNRRVLFREADALGLTEVIQRCTFERQANFFRDNSRAR